MIATIRKSLQIVKDNLRLYLFLNLFFYGLLALSVIYVSQQPELYMAVRKGLNTALRTGPLQSVYQVYHVERNIPLAAVATFLINFVVGAGLMLTLPSFVVPFIGILLMVYRFVLWGFIFGPGRILKIAAIGTLFLEGQGYILAGLAICLQGSQLIRRKHYGFATVKDAYKAGFKLTLQLYVLVAIVLFVAAVFESAVGITTSKPLFPAASKTAALFDTTGQRVMFSGSSVFYDANNTAEADARAVGVLLEDIGYFSLRDTAFARISRNETLFDIELCLRSSYWDKEEIRERFAQVCAELNRSFANRHHQVTAISVEDSGNVTKKVFR